MPCFRHQGAGIDFLCSVAGVPEHCFLSNNGNNCCPQSKLSGDFQLSRVTYDFFVTTVADEQGDNRQDYCQKNSCNAFNTLVAVRMVIIRSLVGKFYASHNNEGTENIGRRVDTVGNHGSGLGDETGNKLAQ